MLVEANVQAACDREQAALDRQAFQNALLATKTTDTGSKAIQRKLVDPAKFCGGPRDPDRFITQLRRRETASASAARDRESFREALLAMSARSSSIIEPLSSSIAAGSTTR
jgi:hypothetical protein